MPLNKLFIHPRAIVETSHVGQGTRIWAFSHILPAARIGKACNICEHVFIENQVVLGDEVTVKSGVYLWDGIEIEDKVFIGPNATFTNDPYPRSKRHLNQPFIIKVRYGASLGAGSVLTPGVTIGRYAMVGAGAVVTKDVLDYELVYGNPARHQGWVCKCGERLNDVDNDKIKCICGLGYQMAGEFLSPL